MIAIFLAGLLCGVSVAAILLIRKLMGYRRQLFVVRQSLQWSQHLCNELEAERNKIKRLSRKQSIDGKRNAALSN